MSLENLSKLDIALINNSPKEIINELVEFRQLLKAADIRDYTLHIDVGYDTNGTSTFNYSLDIYNNAYYDSLDSYIA